MSATDALNKHGGIAIVPAPTCYLCGNPGRTLYENREDRLFNSPGLWDFRQCSNSQCGLIWMDPMPSIADIGKLYSNYYTHQAGRVPHSSPLRKALRSVRDAYLARRFGYVGLSKTWQRPFGWLLYLVPFSRARIDFDIMRLAACDRGRLLEIGCGSGEFLARMQRLQWQVCGIDPDPAAVTAGRQSTGLDLRCGSLEEMSFTSDYFDVITMNHVIEHLHDPLNLLRECHRILRPGGRIVLTSPNTGSWGHRRFGNHWRGLEPPRHLMLFSLSTLQKCADQAGFETVTLRSISRWARNMFVASSEIRSQTRSTSWRQNYRSLEGYYFQALENFAELFSVWLGEEIYFVGRKANA